MAPNDIPNSTIPEGSTEVWKDKKRYLWLIGLVVPSLALVAALVYVVTGQTWIFWIGPIVVPCFAPSSTIASLASLASSSQKSS